MDWCMYEYIGLKVEVDGYVVVVMLDNLLVYIWIVYSLFVLCDLVGVFNVDKGIYVLVIIGGGEKFFFVGVDFKQFVFGDKGVVCEVVC